MRLGQLGFQRLRFGFSFGRGGAGLSRFRPALFQFPPLMAGSKSKQAQQSRDCQDASDDPGFFGHDKYGCITLSLIAEGERFGKSVWSPGFSRLAARMFEQ